MAKFPIYETDQRPPGQSGAVRRSYSTDTGAAEVGRALQGFGQELFELNSDIYRRQGEAELAEALAGANDSIQKMHLRFAENPDEHTYQQDFDETWETDIATREIKNGWAKREYQMRLPSMKVQQEEFVKGAVGQRVEEKWKWAYAETKAKAIANGNTGPVRAMLAKNRGMTPEQKRFELEKINHDAELEATKRWAMNNPEAALADLEDNELDATVHLDREDIMSVRDIAVTAAKDKVYRQNKLVEKASGGLWDIAQKDDFTPQDAVQYINSLPGDVPLDEKRQMLWLATNIKSLLADGKANPLKTRQDYGVYKDLLYGAEDHSRTKEDFRRAVNKGQITLMDYEHLVNVTEEKGGALDESRQLTGVLKSVDRLIDERMKDTDLKETAKIKVHRLLEASLKAAAEKGKPLAGDDLLLEGIRIQRQVEREGLSRSSAEELLPIPPKREPGAPYTLGSGQNIGTYDDAGKVRLNDYGVQQLADHALSRGWTKEQTRAYASKKGYVIP